MDTHGYGHAQGRDVSARLQFGLVPLAGLGKPNLLLGRLAGLHGAPFARKVPSTMPTHSFETQHGL